MKIIRPIACLLLCLLLTGFALAETPEGFVVRSDNGRVGLMRDVQGIERA